MRMTLLCACASCSYGELSHLPSWSSADHDLTAQLAACCLFVFVYTEGVTSFLLFKDGDLRYLTLNSQYLQYLLTISINRSRGSFMLPLLTAVAVTNPWWRRTSSLLSSCLNRFPSFSSCLLFLSRSVHSLLSIYNSVNLCSSEPALHTAVTQIRLRTIVFVFE